MIRTLRYPANTKLKPENRFRVVGLGVPAGGKEACINFVRAIPRRSGMAFVLVEQLDPGDANDFSQTLGSTTSIPVVEFSEGMQLSPDHIYIVPGGNTLTSVNGNLHLSDSGASGNSIDSCFRALAEVHKTDAAGVMLSDRNTDVTEGLKFIRAHGGFTFAQINAWSDEGSNNDNTGLSGDYDFVLPAGKILMQLYSINGEGRIIGETIIEDEEKVLREILSLMRMVYGVDFHAYKQNTIRRRIQKRMEITEKKNFSEYFVFLRENKDEPAALFQELLIHYTSFFRDADTFKALDQIVFPALLQNNPGEDIIRIWSAGCSTGEETYSLAIALTEYLEKSHIKRAVQIFGTDICTNAIVKARKGVFAASRISSVPANILQKYFIKTGNGYRISDRIRELCVFSTHNFIKDSPLSQLDMVSCRNTLIYMNFYLQTKSLHAFGQALKENGCLLLGRSETNDPAPGMFSALSNKDRIYTRSVSQENEDPPLKNHNKNTLHAREKEDGHTLRGDFRKTGDMILLSRYTPASVIVNARMDIVHIRGQLNGFLEPSQGKPSFNLIKNTGGILAHELREAINKSKNSGDTVLVKDIPAGSGKKPSQVTIEVSPLEEGLESYYLVVFRVQEEPVKTGNGIPLQQEDSQRRIRLLELELARTRDELIAVTESQDAVNEEMQYLNEELRSGNEELQSLNEELMNAREELQASNEELIDVNRDLLEKQELLTREVRYSSAIISSICEPFVILDKQLRLRSANPSFYKKFNLREEKITGCSFYEIEKGQWNDPLLRAMLENIITEKIRKDEFEIVLKVHDLGWRTMLLNARLIEDEAEGEEMILLAIEDVTEKKMIEEKGKSFVEQLEHRISEYELALEHANTQIEQFSHTASHEFQEPLRKIVIFSSILQNWAEDELPLKVKEYLGKIEGATVRMRNLIKDMLDFASVTNCENLYERTDLNGILKDVLFDFELLIAEKGARITSDSLPAVEAVPFQMNQLFYDIISNALKFTRPGITPVIHVSAKKVSQQKLALHPHLDKKQPHWEIIFKDNGIGFNQKYAHKIFTMFQRLNESSNYPGTGIGLALCRKIVNNYNGEIFAEGIENTGAAFHVILPGEQKH